MKICSLSRLWIRTSPPCRLHRPDAPFFNGDEIHGSIAEIREYVSRTSTTKFTAEVAAKRTKPDFDDHRRPDLIGGWTEDASQVRASIRVAPALRSTRLLTVTAITVEEEMLDGQHRHRGGHPTSYRVMLFRRCRAMRPVCCSTATATIIVDYRTVGCKKDRRVCFMPALRIGKLALTGAGIPLLLSSPPARRRQRGFYTEQDVRVRVHGCHHHELSPHGARRDLFLYSPD